MLLYKDLFIKSEQSNLKVAYHNRDPSKKGQERLENIEYILKNIHVHVLYVGLEQKIKPMDDDYA